MTLIEQVEYINLRHILENNTLMAKITYAAKTNMTNRYIKLRDKFINQYEITDKFD